MKWARGRTPRTLVFQVCAFKPATFSCASGLFPVKFAEAPGGRGTVAAQQLSMWQTPMHNIRTLISMLIIGFDISVSAEYGHGCEEANQ